LKIVQSGFTDVIPMQYSKRVLDLMTSNISATSEYHMAVICYFSIEVNILTFNSFSTNT